MNTTTPWDARPPSVQSVQLPSIDEGFGSLAPHHASLSSVKCDTCAARGHTVWIPQGITCPRCAINKLTPPPDHPGSRPESLSLPGGRIFSSAYEAESDPLARRPSQGHSLPPRHYHDQYNWVPSTSSSPLMPPSNNMGFPPSNSQLSTPQNPYRHSIVTTQQHSNNTFNFPSDPSGSHHGNKKPMPYRSEKDIRHCDAEKARRDHQATYIDMGFSLRNKFQWPEESASPPSSTTTIPSANSSFSGEQQTPAATDSIAETNAAALKSRKERREAKEKLTKQSKLHQQVLWEFRACLRIDRDRVREWLDEVRSQGEELKRRKQVLMEGQGRGGLREGERERDRVRCVKDEAVMEVWGVMEREFWEFCGEVERDGECGGGGKRKRLTGSSVAE